MTFYVAVCPIYRCAWRSTPLASDTQAFEAARAHLNAHTHADLVEHATRDFTIENYQRQQGE